MVLYSNIKELSERTVQNTTVQNNNRGERSYNYSVAYLEA